MTDLLLIHPGAQHGIYGELGDKLTALEPPTWTRMIAGYFVDMGAEVQIIDAEAEQLKPEEVASKVEQLNPYLTAIVVSGHQPSASTQQMVGAGRIARAIKSRVPTSWVIMTGNHPSALPERTLQEEAIDGVADGEGVLTIQGILARERAPIIPGLVWRDRDNIFINPAAPLVDVNTLHGNVWDKLPMHLYRSHNWQAFGGFARQPYASIYTSLGCPYKCSFCMINVFQHSNKYRMFDPQEVVGQIKFLHDHYGVRTFKIADEMFILNTDHYTSIAQGLDDLGIGDKINIWAYARVDTIKPETLDLLRAAGFRWLALGIESGSEHVRDGANKRLKIGDIVDVVRTIQRAGINVIGNFMFGLRDDTVESMNMTLQLAQNCLPDFANFYCTMAYPGSALYDQAIKEGWTLPETWSGYSQHNSDCRPLDTEKEKASTVLRFRDSAFRVFFNSPAYKAMIQAKFGDQAVQEVDQMLKYKLYRKLLGA